MTSAAYWYLIFGAFGMVLAWATIKGLSDDQ